MKNNRAVRNLAEQARALYVRGPWLLRKMMHYRVYICPFERLLPHVPANSRILDVGCGCGLFLALLAATTPDIDATGFDASAPAIVMANAMADQVRRRRLPVKLQFQMLDARAAWPDGTFDVVSLIDVMHHVAAEHQESLFLRAVEKVGPGGILLYKDMAASPWFPAAMNRLHDLVLARQWIHYVPIVRIEAWARSLHLEHSETMTRFWYRHELRVFRKSSGAPWC